MVVSRLLSTLTLAALASAGALVALAVRTDVAGTFRVIGATVLSALIYAGFGVLVGSLVRSEMTGQQVCQGGNVGVVANCDTPPPIAHRRLTTQ